MNRVRKVAILIGIVAVLFAVTAMSGCVEEPQTTTTEEIQTTTTEEKFNISQVFLSENAFSVLAEVSPGEYKLLGPRFDNYRYCDLDVIVRYYENNTQATMTKIMTKNGKAGINDHYMCKIYIDLPEDMVVIGQEYERGGGGMSSYRHHGQTKNVWS